MPVDEAEIFFRQPRELQAQNVNGTYLNVTAKASDDTFGATLNFVEIV